MELFSVRSQGCNTRNSGSSGKHKCAICTILARAGRGESKPSRGLFKSLGAAASVAVVSAELQQGGRMAGRYVGLMVLPVRLILARHPSGRGPLMSDLHNASSHDSDKPIPRPLCPTCCVEMWLAMAPPRPTADIKEDWLFECPVCKDIVLVAEP